MNIPTGRLALQCLSIMFLLYWIRIVATLLFFVSLCKWVDSSMERGRYFHGFCQGWDFRTTRRLMSIVIKADYRSLPFLGLVLWPIVKAWVICTKCTLCMLYTLCTCILRCGQCTVADVLLSSRLTTRRIWSFKSPWHVIGSAKWMETEQSLVKSVNVHFIYSLNLLHILSMSIRHFLTCAKFDTVCPRLASMVLSGFNLFYLFFLCIWYPAGTCPFCFRI